ncbi:MAG: hypothetical protein HKN10_11690 [Myxococcales bacterium]|nr:hypothetical protein [Myxococcales bacterium]
MTFEVDEECEEALLAVVECAEQSPCLEFPIFIDMLAGGCPNEVEAFKTCIQPSSASRGRVP